MNNVTTDEHGRLLGFPHHDGALEGLLLEDGGKTAILLVRSSDAVLRRLILERVVGLHVVDLRQGNIIQSIQAWDVATARVAVPGIVGAVLARLYLEVSALPATALIIQLTPSYGADVLAVCAEVRAEEGR